MSVYKRADQETYSFDFKVRGHRFSGNTEARNRKDAEAVERKLKAKAKADVEAERRTGNGPLLLRHAAGRYWDEVGQHHRDSTGHASRAGLADQALRPRQASRRDRRRRRRRLGRVATCMWSHGQEATTDRSSPATVNRSVVEPLRKLFIRARDSRGATASRASRYGASIGSRNR